MTSSAPSPAAMALAKVTGISARVKSTLSTARPYPIRLFFKRSKMPPGRRS